MLTEEILADYLDRGLPEEQSAWVDEMLLQDPEKLREVVDQEQMDAALSMLLGGQAIHEQVLKGILADLAADSTNQTQRRVLRTMTRAEKPRLGHRNEWRVMGLFAVGMVLFLGLLAWWQSWEKQRELAQKINESTVPETPLREEKKISAEPPKPALDSTAPIIVEQPKPPPVSPPPSVPPPAPPMVTQQPPKALPEKPPVILPKDIPTPPAARPPGKPIVKPATPVVVAINRVAADWPFASDSPWNTPLGSGAQYLGARFAVREKFDPDRIGIRIRPMLREMPGETVQRLMADGKDLGSFALRIPPSAFNNIDQPLALLKSDGTSMLELRKVDFTQQGLISAKYAWPMDLHSSGFQGGITESGASCLGGMVRAGEIEKGIPHALAIAVNIQWLSLKGAKLTVWPATSSAYPTRSFKSSGNVHYGTLLAIPPTVKIEILNLGGKGTAGYEIAKALQDYGAYVVETCRNQQLHFYFEDGNLPPDLADTLARLCKELHVVNNNSAATPGGGGRPRVAPAPALPK